MRIFLTLLSAGLAAASIGCAPYLRAQTDLVHQARRGVAMLDERHSAHVANVEELARLRRQRLDEAFDADVLAQNGAISADWIIEHRKAYAVGLDAYAEQRRAALEASAAERSNIQAIDAALQRLQWLQSIPTMFTKEVFRDTRDNNDD